MIWTDRRGKKRDIKNIGLDHLINIFKFLLKQQKQTVIVRFRIEPKKTRPILYVEDGLEETILNYSKEIREITKELKRRGVKIVSNKLLNKTNE